MKFVRLSRLLAGALLVAGAGLTIWAALTPAYSDVNAYSAGLERLRTDLYGGGGTALMEFDLATRQFHALNNEYGTSKWLITDLAYSAVAWSVLVFLAGSICDHHPLSGTRRAWPVALGCLSAGGLIGVGALVGVFQERSREVVPVWADTPAIPLFGAIGVVLVLVPIILTLALTPVIFTRRSSAGLLSAKGRGWLSSTIATVIYAGPLLIALLCVGLFWSTGGWAVSTAGGVLCWLLLNARAIWIGHEPEVAA